MERCTIADIAREAGVSVTTVSRVLNHRPDVAKVTRERVESVIARLGYVANPAARRLAGARARTLGLLLPALGSGYAMEILRGVAEASAEAEYDLVLYAVHEPLGEDGKERVYLSAFARGAVDGLVVVLPRTDDRALEELWQRGLPTVLVDHRAKGSAIPSVVTTNYQGALDGTRYLLGLGHRRIGFITGDLQVPAAVERLKGYQQALIEAGLPIDDELIYRGDFRLRSGYAGTQALMRLANPPTAIFASNDDSALGAMDALRDLGYRIAEDVSVLGFDDIRASAEAHPPLTTVHQPLAQMGRTAVEMLLRLLTDGVLSEYRIELPTKLVVRGSCARPPARS